VQATGLIHVLSGERVGPLLDFGVDALLTVGGLVSTKWWIAALGGVKLAVDLGATGYKTFVDPFYRYAMTSGETPPNPFYFLGW
jgi:hypothetical protein